MIHTTTNVTATWRLTDQQQPHVTSRVSYSIEWTLFYTILAFTCFPSFSVLLSDVLHCIRMTPNSALRLRFTHFYRESAREFHAGRTISVVDYCYYYNWNRPICMQLACSRFLPYILVSLLYQLPA